MSSIAEPVAQLDTAIHLLSELQWNGLQLPGGDTSVVEQELVSEEDHPVPVSVGGVHLGEDEIEDGGEDAATEMSGEDVGGCVADLTGDDVTDDIDLAVSAVVLTGAGVLAEGIDNCLRILSNFPGKPR